MAAITKPVILGILSWILVILLTSPLVLMTLTVLTSSLYSVFLTTSFSIHHLAYLDQLE